MTIEASRTGPDGGDGRLWDLIDAGVFLSEELELDLVLRRIVETACRIIGARYGALGVLDEKRSGLANFVFTGLTERDRERIGHLPVGRGLLGALIDDPRAIRLRDLADDPRSVGFPPSHPPMHSFLGVPIRSRGEVFGNLYLTEKTEGDFTEEDERLATMLASQAGVAIENARLFAESRAAEVASGRRLVELESVHELGSALLSEVEPSRVLRLIAMRARELVRADTTVIMLLEEHDEVAVRVAAGVRAGASEGLHLSIEGTFSELAVREREPILVDDVRAEPRGRSPLMRAVNGRSVIFAPLLERAEGAGVLAVIHEEQGFFKEEDRLAVGRFATLASFALRNARLISAERERAEAETQLAEARVREQLREQTLRAVIRAQEDERRRIARELHDSAGQALTSILLGLTIVEQQKDLVSARERLAELREIAGAAAADVRRILLELRPSVLDDLGLADAIHRLAADVTERTGVEVAADVNLDGRLDPEVETVTYRIAQEAVTNVLKHARADNIWVELARDGGLVRLCVRDDGQGFDLDERGSGLGLSGMRERADLVGGILTLEAEPGRGATVLLEIPVKPASSEEDDVVRT